MGGEESGRGFFHGGEMRREKLNFSFKIWRERERFWLESGGRSCGVRSEGILMEFWRVKPRALRSVGVD